MMSSDGPRLCFSENAIAALACGGLAGLPGADRHLAECSACAALVAAVADGEAEALGAPPRSSDPRVVLPGTRVGRYVVDREVGAGAMGSVYRAYDPDLDRHVALKLLRPDTGGPDLEARLVREAKAMARLSHPAVITVHDIGRHGDQVFIAMELVTGGTLRTWLGQAPRSPRAILDVFVRAGRGLAEAHAAGLVHRDFKPDNVLVGADGRVRVTDFGLARAVFEVDHAEHPAAPESLPIDELRATLTRTGALVGTPAYMAPEQLRSAPADARSDMFSFCVALWEALCGERPYGGTTLRDLRASIGGGRPREPPRGRRIPARLRRALARGLAPLPEQRHASMGALLDALAPPPRRPAVRVVAAGLVALAALVAGGRALLSARPSIEQARPGVAQAPVAAPPSAVLAAPPVAPIPAALAPAPPPASKARPGSAGARRTPAPRAAPTRSGAAVVDEPVAPAPASPPIALGKNGAPILR